MRTVRSDRTRISRPDAEFSGCMSKPQHANKLPPAEKACVPQKTVRPKAALPPRRAELSDASRIRSSEVCSADWSSKETSARQKARSEPFPAAESQKAAEPHLPPSSGSENHVKQIPKGVSP